MDEGERLGLRPRGGDDVAPAVAQRRGHRAAAHRVEVPAAGRVLDPDAVAADGDRHRSPELQGEDVRAVALDRRLTHSSLLRIEPARPGSAAVAYGTPRAEVIRCGPRTHHGITQHSGHRAVRRGARRRTARVERSRSMTDVKEILEGWQKQDIGFVRFELPDMHGISRSKTIPIAHAARLRGAWPQHVRRDERPRHPLRRRRRDAVPRGARLRRPAAVPRPGVRPGAAVGRPHGAAHLRRRVVRRVAARGDASARLPPGAREGSLDGLRAAPGVGVRVLPPDR